MKLNIKKMIALLIGMVIICVGSIAGYIGYTKSKSVIKTELFPIEESFIVNINSGTKETKILKTSLTLEYTGKKGADTITENMSKINDTLISTLSSKTEKELGPDNRENLKKELIKKINDTLKEEIIVDIFFTDFLIN